MVKVWPTLDHKFASLAARRPTEDMFLKTVDLDLLGLRLWLGLKGPGQ